MTNHIGEATEKVIDLDALEKLADEGLKLATGSYTEKGVYRHSTIKALIAELKEARGLLSLVATDAFDCQEDSCLVSHGIIADIRAFLARNGKGEG